jgi:glycosidase
VPNHVARQYKSDAKPARVKDLGETDDKAKGFDQQNNFYYILGEQLHVEFAATDNLTYEELPARATGNDCFHAWPNRNDWYETVKLNYGVDYCAGGTKHFSPTPNTWKKMTAILLFWAKKGVDAFRCDMAEMVPVEFWKYAIKEVKKKFPHVQFIAEVYNPAEYRNYIKIGGFDYLYDKGGLYDTLRAIVCHQQPAAAITGAWQSVDDIYSHMLNFLENHAEQRIASDYFAHTPEKAKPALVVSALMRETPLMIYAGQEIGERGMTKRASRVAMVALRFSTTGRSIRSKNSLPA